MTKTRFTFPEGTTTITSEEYKEALCNYEVVEMPGSVADVCIIIDYYNQLKAKELILNEGTLSLKIACPQIDHYKKQFKYNMPSTLQKIDAWACSQVVCIGESVTETNIRGARYLQLYDHSNPQMTYEDHDLVHLVILGKKVAPAFVWNLCDCWDYYYDCFKKQSIVVHVQDHSTAKKVIKWVKQTAIVVPDADEWKDFPTDLRRMSMEKYDPWNRILEEQEELVHRPLRWSHLRRSHSKQNKKREEDFKSILLPYTNDLDIHESLKIKMLECHHGSMWFDIGHSHNSYLSLEADILAMPIVKKILSFFDTNAGVLEMVEDGRDYINTRDHDGQTLFIGFLEHFVLPLDQSKPKDHLEAIIRFKNGLKSLTQEYEMAVGRTPYFTFEKHKTKA